MKRRTARSLKAAFAVALTALALTGGAFAPALAQGLDCNRLAAQIAAASRGGGGQYAAAAQKQRAELARTSAYASQLGCDRPQFFLFGDRPPQCAGINAQISRMQSNLQGLSQAAYGGDGVRAMLQQRFDTYCRGAENYGTARNFFERLFDTGRQDRFGQSPADAAPPIIDDADGDGDGRNARGGSQAICVRTCDGGFFPMSVAARRRDLSELQDLCSALCPGTETKLFTRVPGRELSTAVSVDGNAYSDLPNALKFEKAFDKTCSCKPADKTWVEALADAERLLGEERKGDIVVTAERAEELSRVAGPGAGRDRKKFDPRAIAKAVGIAQPADDTARAIADRQRKSADEATAADAVAAANAPTAGTESSGIARAGGEKDRVVGKGEGVKTEASGPEGARRKVRIIAPQL